MDKWQTESKPETQANKWQVPMPDVEVRIVAAKTEKLEFLGALAIGKMLKCRNHDICKELFGNDNAQTYHAFLARNEKRK